MKKITYSIFLLLLLPFSVVSQQTSNLILLTDASGIDRTPYIGELEVAADALVAVLPPEYQNQFKVFDFGFYLHHEVFEGGYQGVFEKMKIEAAEISPYYLLIGKQSDQDGIYSKFWIDINLPDFTSCYDNGMVISSVQSSTDGLYQVLNHEYLKFAEVEIYAINTLSELVQKLYYCCSDQNSNARSVNFECNQDESFPEITNGSQVEREPSLKEKIYMAPTGKLIKLPVDAKGEDFFQSGEGIHPRGALLSFWIKEIEYRAHTNEARTHFLGYKSKLSDVPYAFEGPAFNVGEKVKVRTSTQYNAQICSRKVFSFEYEIPFNYYDLAGPNESFKDGGVGLEKVAPLPLEFSVYNLVLEVESGSILGGNKTIPFEEAINLFGQGISYLSLNYAEEDNIPCPDVEVTDAQLQGLSEGKYRLYKDGSFIQWSQYGIIYWQLDGAEFFTYYFDPRTKKYILFTPETHAWLTPSDVFNTLLLEVQTTLQDPHITLAFVGATDTPILSQLADLADAGIYFYEGEVGEGFLSLAGVLPGVTAATRGGKWSIKLGKNLKFYSNAVPEFTPLHKDASSLEDFIYYLNFTEEQAIKLSKHLGESEGLAKAMLDNPRVTSAWKVFDDAGIALDFTDAATVDKLIALAADLAKGQGTRFADSMKSIAGAVKSWEALINAPDWARLNTDILELGAKESDDVIRNKFGDFYATTMKNQTPSGFDGGEKIYGGVWYNKYGFPDFEHLNQTIGKQYNFPGAKGNYTTDFTDARDWLKKQPGIEAIDDYNGTGSPLNVKIGGSWKKITWHHHENGTHLLPVFTDVHTGLSHTGGVKTVELGINHLFDYLN